MLNGPAMMDVLVGWVWRVLRKRLVRPMRCSMATRKLRGRGCNPSRRRSPHRPAASCTEVPRPRAHAGSPDGRWIGGSVQSAISALVSRRMILRARRTPNKGWACASMRRIARHITLRPPTAGGTWPCVARLSPMTGQSLRFTPASRRGEPTSTLAASCWSTGALPNPRETCAFRLRACQRRA